MTTDGPRWDKIEASLSDGERDALLVFCRFHRLDLTRWRTVASLRAVFCTLAINREADALFSSGEETEWRQARRRAAIKLGLDSESYERMGRRWRKEQRRQKQDTVSVRSGPDCPTVLLAV